MALTCHHAAIVRPGPALDEILRLDEPRAAHLLLADLGGSGRRTQWEVSYGGHLEGRGE